MSASPKSLPIVVENIPTELKEHDQWAAWRWELRGGKWSKPPLNPSTGRYARNNDPNTWGSFEPALGLMRRRRLPGIGFMFHPEDPFAGLDLDGCRNPLTTEVEPWAREIVEEMDSYTEVSPSGTGLKIFVRGKLPPGRRRKGNIEMYDCSRFFTTTGHRVPGVPLAVRNCQAKLNALHGLVFGEPAARLANGKGEAHQSAAHGSSDAELIDRAMRAANGEKFARLWAGDPRDYGTAGNEGRSEADLALCSMLAFWCGPDEARIDGFFRLSGLMREKWDDRHYGDGRTYGQGTIGNALQGRGEFWNGPRPRSRSRARRVRRRAARG